MEPRFLGGGFNVGAMSSPGSATKPQRKVQSPLTSSGTKPMSGTGQKPPTASSVTCTAPTSTESPRTTTQAEFAPSTITPEKDKMVNITAVQAEPVSSTATAAPAPVSEKPTEQEHSQDVPKSTAPRNTEPSAVVV